MYFLIPRKFLASLMLPFLIVRVLATDTTVSVASDDDWKQFEELIKFVGPLPAPYKSFVGMPEFERMKYLEARARCQGEFALSYYANHPQDPRRWMVVDRFVFSMSPRFVSEWGALDAAGKPHPLLDEAAAAVWKSKVAELRAAMQVATDVPPEVQKAYAARERRAASQRVFEERWQSGRHELAPDISVSAPDGRVTKLSDFRGKIVVLDFWATWCGPCQDAIPHNQDVAARYKAQNVVVLGVCVWDQKEKFDSWLKENQALYPDIVWAFDPAGRTDSGVARKLYDVPAIPAEFIIDVEGKVVEALLGFSDSEGSGPLDEALARAGVKVTPLIKHDPAR